MPGWIELDVVYSSFLEQKQQLEEVERNVNVVLAGHDPGVSSQKPAEELVNQLDWAWD